MDYASCYERLMQRARTRVLDGYVEKHHAVPKCIGGSNSKENVVVLTPEEHYVAHQLLVKMHPGNHRLLWAAVSMTKATRKMARRGNKLYGWLRRLFAAMIGNRTRGLKRSAEARANMSKAHLGKKRDPHTEETKRKMSAASLGRPKSAEHVAAMSRWRSGRKLGPRGPNSPEANENIRRANAKKDRSYMQTDEYREKMRKKSSEIWAARKAGLLPMPSRKKN